MDVLRGPGRHGEFLHEATPAGFGSRGVAHGGLESRKSNVRIDGCGLRRVP